MKKNSKSNKQEYIATPKHEIPEMNQDKVNLIDSIFDLLIESNFDLDVFDKNMLAVLDSFKDPEERELVSKLIPMYRKRAKDMRDEAIQRGLIRERLKQDMNYEFNKNPIMSNKGIKPYYTPKTEYLAIVSNDESGIFQVMSFDTEKELNSFAEKAADGLNYVTKYKAIKLN